MYRLFDRRLNTTSSQVSNSTTHESTSVIVFKCSNKESKLLVDTIRSTLGRTLKSHRRFVSIIFHIHIFLSIFSHRVEPPRNPVDRTGAMPFYDSHDPSTMIRKL
jgi:hypothetical protein